MSKKVQNAPQEKPKKRVRFTDFIAFFALLLSAVLFIVGPILRKFAGATGEMIANIASTVAEVLLILAIALPAWYFARKGGIFGKVVYFVCLIAFIVGIVLGYAL